MNHKVMKKQLDFTRLIGLREQALRGKDPYLERLKKDFKLDDKTLGRYEEEQTQRNRILHFYYHSIFPKYLGEVKNVEYIFNHQYGILCVEYFFNGIESKDTIFEEPFSIQMIYQQHLISAPGKVNFFLPFTIAQEIIMVIRSENFGVILPYDTVLFKSFPEELIWKNIENMKRSIEIIQPNGKKASNMDIAVGNFMKERIDKEIFDEKISIQKSILGKSYIRKMCKETVDFLACFDCYYIWLQEKSDVYKKYKWQLYDETLEKTILGEDIDYIFEEELEGINKNSQLFLKRSYLYEEYKGDFSLLFRYSYRDDFSLKKKDYAQKLVKKANLVESKKSIAEKPYNDMYIFFYDYTSVQDEEYEIKSLGKTKKNKTIDGKVRIQKICIRNKRTGDYFFVNVYERLSCLSSIVSVEKHMISLSLPMFAYLPFDLELSDPFDVSILQSQREELLNNQSSIVQETYSFDYIKSRFKDFEISFEVDDSYNESGLVGLSDFLCGSRETTLKPAEQWAYHSLLKIYLVADGVKIASFCKEHVFPHFNLIKEDKTFVLFYEMRELKEETIHFYDLFSKNGIFIFNPYEVSEVENSYFCKIKKWIEKI